MLVDKARWLSALSAIAHFGLVISFVVNTQFQNNNAFQIFPEWFWPLVFGIQGTLALLGWIKLDYLRFSFYMGASVMVGWSIAAVLGAYEKDQFPGTALWLLYIGGLKWLVAEYALKLQKAQKIAEAALKDGTTTTS